MICYANIDGNKVKNLMKVNLPKLSAEECRDAQKREEFETNYYNR